MNAVTQNVYDKLFYPVVTYYNVVVTQNMLNIFNKLFVKTERMFNIKSKYVEITYCELHNSFNDVYSEFKYDPDTDTDNMLTLLNGVAFDLYADRSIEVYKTADDMELADLLI